MAQQKMVTISIVKIIATITELRFCQTFLFTPLHVSLFADVVEHNANNILLPPKKLSTKLVGADEIRKHRGQKLLHFSEHLGMKLCRNHGVARGSRGTKSWYHWAVDWDGALFRHKKYRTRMITMLKLTIMFIGWGTFGRFYGDYSLFEERFDDASIYQSDTDFACFQLLDPIRWTCRFQIKSHKISMREIDGIGACVN